MNSFFLGSNQVNVRNYYLDAHPRIIGYAMPGSQIVQPLRKRMNNGAIEKYIPASDVKNGMRLVADVNVADRMIDDGVRWRIDTSGDVDDEVSIDNNGMITAPPNFIPTRHNARAISRYNGTFDEVGLGFNLDSFTGEILECYNCFLPDHRYSRMTSSGNLMFEGGVRYGADFWHSHNFGVDITMAFTPLPSGAWHSRMCRITHDFANWPENIHTWSQWDTDGFGTPAICTCPPPTGHPSNWSSFLRHGPARQWEANALAAFSRAGVHGFNVVANMPDMTPPVGLENSYHPDFRFISYLQLFQWVQMGNVRQWFTNNDAGKIITHSSNHSITPAGHVTTRIQAGAFAWDPNWQMGPDYWPFEFSAYEHHFDDLPNTRSPNNPYVFWIYDYSNQLGTTLQNLEEIVESPEGTTRAVFPRGHIPHEDTLGAQNGIWAYRWISNRWKYAPWERYPNLMPT